MVVGRRRQGQRLLSASSHSTRRCLYRHHHALVGSYLPPPPPHKMQVFAERDYRKHLSKPVTPLGNRTCQRGAITGSIRVVIRRPRSLLPVREQLEHHRNWEFLIRARCPATPKYPQYDRWPLVLYSAAKRQEATATALLPEIEIPRSTGKIPLSAQNVYSMPSTPSPESFGIRWVGQRCFKTRNVSRDALSASRHGYSLPITRQFWGTENTTSRRQFLQCQS
jgi:hypothetical protein